MQLPDWFVMIGAFFSGIAAVINAFIAVKWGRAFAQAKEAEIETLRSQLDMYNPTNLEQTVVSMRKIYEEANNQLKEQMTELEKTVDRLEGEIRSLKETADPSAIEDIKIAREKAQQAITNLSEEIQRVKKDERDFQERETKLSKRQRRILEFVEVFTRKAGYPPTIGEIGSAVGISSTSVVNYNLNVLEREGFISRDKTVSRGIATF